jgi:hypothetical protein
MPFWRRDEPVHKKLAKALLNAQAGGYLAHPPDLEGNVTTGAVGLHGVPRPRRWDVVIAVETRLDGDELHFAALPDGTLIVDEDVPEGALAPLAEAVEEQLPPPYRAEGTRRGDGLWAVGASAIDVARVPEEITGDAIQLVVHGAGHALEIDGIRTFGTVPSLEALARGLPAYVLRAERLDGELWHITLAPL